MKTPKIKFSYNYSKGSDYTRRIKSRRLADNLCSNVLQLYESAEAVPLRDIEKACRNFMPEKVYFYVQKTNSKNDAGSLFYHMLEHSLRRYGISLPTQQNFFLKKDIPTLVHEMTHLFNNLFLPKQIKNTETLFMNHLDDFTMNLYNRLYYDGNVTGLPAKTSTKKAKRITEDKLKGFPNRHKIMILKYIKWNLQDELNAYKSEEECGEKLKQKGKIFSYDNCENIDNEYKMISKIEMLKKLLFGIINQQKYIIESDNAKSKIEKLKLFFNYCIKSIIYLY